MSSNRDWVNQMSGDPDEATPASSMPTITTGKILETSIIVTSTAHRGCRSSIGKELAGHTLGPR